MTSYEPGLLGNLLPLYYKKVFPSGLLCRWLNYSGVGCFHKREFSFTLKDDVYIRYLSYANQEEFEKDLLRLCPYKIDIGAVYTHKPRDMKAMKAGTYRPLEKELVFDVDVSDYDDVRFCCSGADICLKCWPLMAMAVQIIDRGLKEDLGFEGVLWVYSGRRGVHAWVVDERGLDQQARSAIVDYFTLVKGGSKMAKKVNLKSAKIHPFISTSLALVEDSMDDFLFNKQDFLSDQHKLNALLPLLPEPLRGKVADFIREEGDLTSRTRWEVLRRLNDARMQELRKMLAAEKRSLKDVREQLRQHERLLSEIKLQYCYPRLDTNVSIGVNHLLKSPFSIHPKTGRVCVPFEASRAFDFDPSAVPTICDVLRDHKDLSTSSESADNDGYGCMEESVRIFRQFIEGVELRALKKIDVKDVARFSRLSRQWWDLEGEFKLLHTMNRLRVPFIRDRLEKKEDAPLHKPLQGLRLLDVGCGGGLLSEPLSRLGASVVGLDASEENIATARFHQAAANDMDNLTYVASCLEDISGEHAAVFDGVVLSEVVEHVHDLALFMQHACSVVKPGGSIFITTINRTQLSYWTAIFIAEKLLRLVPDGIHDWNKFVTPAELQDLLSQNHMSTRLVQGMLLNPVTSQWSCIADSSVNYALHAVKDAAEAISRNGVRVVVPIETSS